jgi:putative SOS response-associated peptidase YedK
MCGRYTRDVGWATVHAFSRPLTIAAPAEDPAPAYNIAPTQRAWVLLPGGDGDPVQAVARELRWGLVPFWAKDVSVGARMINARAESVLDKSAFRRPFERRRCILPADGFYEWQAVEGQKKKQPWYIRRRDGDVLAFAGLWDSWRPVKGSDEGRVVSCSIITTEANDAIAPLHDRMPVVLPPSAWAAWLDPDNDRVEDLHRLLVPAPDDLLELTPVGFAVSDVRNDGPHLLDPVSP